MRQVTFYIGVVALCSWAIVAQAGPLRCPPDSVKVGTTCVDKYEASVWQIAPDNTALVKKVQQGRATLADLTAGGALQLVPATTCLPFPSANFNVTTGEWSAVPGSNPPSPGVYAVSIPGVPPSGCMSWFAANQACLLSGKRLLTNVEWQGAAAGTPDPGAADDGATTCATNSPGPVNTGSRSNCKSSWGVFDMVGNAMEFVADWADLADAGNCTNWSNIMSGIPADRSCYGGSGSGWNNQLPAGVFRGGYWAEGADAGILAVNAMNDPTEWASATGFRCGR